VGAVIASGARTLGEGFHHVRGEAHAEVEALRDAAARGNDPRGATLYVTLEPCDHTGLTPPCSRAVVEAGIARAVVGTLDPNPRTDGGGIARLRAAGIAVEVVDDAWSRAIVEDFAVATRGRRPYVRLKLAASLDGRIAPRPGERHWLTGARARDYVRELRAACDAVMVGAGTVRIDDPQLSVRPPRARRKPYVRVVVCEQDTVPAERAVFAPLDGYAPTIVLAPAGARARFANLAGVADLVFVGGDDALQLDLTLAFEALRERGVASVLCEGGPTLAGRMVEAALVDRVDWLLAPELLSGPSAVPALVGGPSGVTLRFERVERLGPDLLVSAVIA
jgi:diaminohydroxyphosphoribosylaminopyrimidine deaminase/5-amino-6-(5-phosphoribosylamino)uracil reductase